MLWPPASWLIVVQWRDRLGIVILFFAARVYLKWVSSDLLIVVFRTGYPVGEILGISGLRLKTYFKTYT